MKLNLNQSCRLIAAATILSTGLVFGPTYVRATGSPADSRANTAATHDKNAKKKDKKNKKGAEEVKLHADYHFSHPGKASVIRPYSYTAYAANDNTITTMRGDNLFETKDTITDFQVNPSGVNMLMVKKNKKNRYEAAIYSTLIADARAEKYNVKKLGAPLAIAYTPDARRIIVATADSMFTVDPRQLRHTATFASMPLVPQKLFVSPNGQIMAAVTGDKLAVYNLEQLTHRRTLDLGEKINDVTFSPDNTDMAVLTDDGTLSIFNARSLELRKMIDDLGASLSADYNLDGKYVVVATAPDEATIVNVLRDTERTAYPTDGTGLRQVEFIPDVDNNTLLVYSVDDQVNAQRIPGLQPYYNRLINEEVNQKMDEWLKMMPGETMEQYRARVNDENQTKQRRMFEYEISTRLAGNLIGGMKAKIGAYDRANEILAIELGEMPTMFIKVPENEAVEFRNDSDVMIDEVLYGVNPDDSFDIVYARITNRANGKSYYYDNLNRKSMDFINSDNLISLEVLQQQQMEELKLRQLREKVMQEAKSRNVISDNTSISVNSRVVPDFDADGNNILNYEITFSYEVAPEYSVVEDFGPGKYHVEESGAAMSMLDIVKQAFEGDLQRYLDADKKLRVNILGTADATPILRGLNYDGSYGYYDNEPVYLNGQLSALTIAPGEKIMQNEQLALLRALGVDDFMKKNIDRYNGLDKDYRYEVNVSEDKGSEFRRITLCFTFVDAF